MSDAIELTKALVALPGPPGEEEAVRNALIARLESLNLSSQVDEKGNLLTWVGEECDDPLLIVTAHMDEIALMISQIEADGAIRVVPLGGAHVWKWGEGPVEILTSEGELPGILSLGSIHTTSSESATQYARENALTWDKAWIWTGLGADQLRERKVHPGCRVALGRSRRVVSEIGAHIASYFLDDRALLAVWLLALERLKANGRKGILFAATTYEEVGGEGALYLLHRYRPPICIALEIGPRVPESLFEITASPTVWVNDSYSACDPQDLRLLEECAAQNDQTLHWQALSRGGSDASCAASKGLTARPVTIALPVENSHGYEIMHRNAVEDLVKLLLSYVERVWK